MNLVSSFGHQGDVQMYKVNCVPTSAKKVEKQFIAASERSGSFHAAFGNYDLYEHEGGFVLDAKDNCIMNHSLQAELDSITLSDVKVIPKKDHNANLIPKGIYFIGIQNRFDPLAGVKKRVID